MSLVRSRRSEIPMALVLAILIAALAACSQNSRLKARCMSGDVTVCTQLGDMFATGKGVPRDMGRAAEMYERACGGGAADVCNTLGEIYEKSGAIEGGVERSTQMFQRGCDGGSSAGCLNLGLAFAAREDKVRAAGLYEKSCSGGWAPGCHQLAVSYEQGEGVAKDVTRAIGFYTQACDGEHVESCLAIGNLYAAGELVPRDMAAAIRMYGKALALHEQSCAAGSQNDCTERDRIRNRIMILSAAPPASPGATKEGGVR
ncbi:MAG TPA: tetratricopeptide repeat protein [Vicinamibacterales bacterium]|jgi:hypothetical protein